LPQPFQKAAAHIKLPGMLFLPGQIKKQNERVWRTHSKKTLNFQKTALPIHRQTGYNFSSVGFRRTPARVFQGTPFR
jgi:hypothetical protein